MLIRTVEIDGKTIVERCDAWEGGCPRLESAESERDRLRAVADWAKDVKPELENLREAVRELRSLDRYTDYPGDPGCYDPTGRYVRWDDLDAILARHLEGGGE